MKWEFRAVQWHATAIPHVRSRLLTQTDVSFTLNTVFLTLPKVVPWEYMYLP